MHARKSELSSYLDAGRSKVEELRHHLRCEELKRAILSRSLGHVEKRHTELTEAESSCYASVASYPSKPAPTPRLPADVLSEIWLNACESWQTQGLSKYPDAQHVAMRKSFGELCRDFRPITVHASDMSAPDVHS